MIEIILFLLIILWLLGYITIPGLIVPKIPIFYFNRKAITLWEIFIFLVVLWAIETLPTPFKEVFTLVLILWILSTVGIISIAGLSQILIVSLIAGMAISIFSHNKTKKD